ncbi:hypothetical protein AGMMS49982_01480 [Bacteroidia bacterium]|nr:hypothetical protein AGMMS49982_01480 [Bacteroidia bacterium]
MAAALILGGCAENSTVQVGGIYGAITDKATGELIKTAGVQLDPGGIKTVTGSEGQYQFDDLASGTYSLTVTKTGYKDLVGYSITVESGKTAKGDAQIEKLPAALRTTNSAGQDITELDLGESAGVITANFNIFNDGVATLEWDITESSEWITGVSKTEGVLQPGKTQGIVVTIDRDKLDGGENTTKLYINSNDGSKEMTVKATGAVKILAVLNTLATTNVAQTSATLNGIVTNAGQPAYTERGFVYATSSMPTIETTITKLTASVTTNNDYSAIVTGLTLGQTYYVRAYAINTVGTAYSTNEVSFTTEELLAEVSTQAVNNISIGGGSATLNGTIVKAGDPAYTERGFVYGTIHNPTVEDDTKKVSTGNGTGVFSANITNVAEGNIYYVRAYATNNKGTAYGEEVALDFNAVMPTLTTQAVTSIGIGSEAATFNGTIVSIGDLSITERGFVYGTAHNPSIDDTKKIASGIGTGVFSVNVTGIAEGNIYYVRAYATNNKGTAYGSEVSVDFHAIMPTPTTGEAININVTSATLTGTIVSVGDPAYTERGFVYATFTNPDVENGTKKIVNGSGTGSYDADITGLTTGTTYYVRAYATSIKGTTYGEQVSFKPESPTVVVLSASGLMVQKVDIGNGSWSAMNNLCQNSTLDGFTDWRLPTKNELAVLYNEKSAIGGFSTKYWSSSSSTSFSDYWYQEFTNGSQSTTASFNGINARCVRSLP